MFLSLVSGQVYFFPFDAFCDVPQFKEQVPRKRRTFRILNFISCEFTGVPKVGRLAIKTK